jgi:hypothetical protein
VLDVVEAIVAHARMGQKSQGREEEEEEVLVELGPALSEAFRK